MEDVTFEISTNAIIGFIKEKSSILIWFNAHYFRLWDNDYPYPNYEASEIYNITKYKRINELIGKMSK